MDQIIMQIGSVAISGWGAAALVLLLVFLAIGGAVIYNLNASNNRIASAGEKANDELRSNFNQQLAERDARLRDADLELNRLRKGLAEKQSENVRLEALMQERDAQNAQNLERFEEARAKMAQDFKHLAADISKQQSDTFTKQNREQVDQLLRPLREKIGEFQRDSVQGREQLKAQLQHLAKDSFDMRSEAQNLTRALKSNSQTQGAWGEMILSSVLERSGLVEGEHYTTQQSYSDDDGRVRTDVEIILPEGKGKVIVDSKVSLTAFEAYTNCEEDDMAQSLLKDHIQSLRTHAKTLGGKEYHRRAESDFDFVIMFVPIEGAFALALRHDAELVDFAYGQNVSITTPTTLLSALRTISNVWDVDKRNKNAQDIAERAGRLYDKFVGFIGTMDKLGKSLDAAQSSFAEAKGQLSEGSGNVVRQVEMLQKLGAKSQKQIPASWQNEDADISLSDDDKIVPLLKSDQAGED